MAEQPPNVEPPAAVDFIPAIGFQHNQGYFEEHTIEETFYASVDLTDATVSNIYYLPVEFPQMLFGKEKYKHLSHLLSYVDKEITWEIFDVRVENQLKGTGVQAVPLEMSNVGMRVFNPDGNLTICNRIYPLQDVDDLVLITHLQENSRKKIPSTLPTNKLYENGYCFVDGTLFSNVINTRDPRFIEKNNVAEKVVFSSTWKNDIGLRKHIFHLLNDTFIEKDIWFADHPEHGPSACMIDTSLDNIKTAGLHTEKWRLINATRGDYADGWITNPGFGLNKLQKKHEEQHGNAQKMLCVLDRQIITNELVPGKSGNVATFIRGNDSTSETIFPNNLTEIPFKYENHFDQFIQPYWETEFDSKRFKDTEVYKVCRGAGEVYWGNYMFNYLPTITPFQGNKAIKPLYLCFDPSYIGAQVMPTTVRFRIRYKHVVEGYGKEWTYERPELYPDSKNIPGPNQIYFGKDVLYSMARQNSPFSDSADKKDLYDIQGQQKMFLPKYVTMFKEKIVNYVKEGDMEPIRKR